MTDYMEILKNYNGYTSNEVFSMLQDIRKNHEERILEKEKLNLETDTVFLDLLDVKPTKNGYTLEVNFRFLENTKPEKSYLMEYKEYSKKGKINISKNSVKIQV